jgi:hypothetical protein
VDEKLKDNSHILMQKKLNSSKEWKQQDASICLISNSDQTIKVQHQCLGELKT